MPRLAVLEDEQIYATHGTEEDISDLVGDVRPKVSSADDVPRSRIFFLEFAFDRFRDILEVLLRRARVMRKRLRSKNARRTDLPFFMSLRASTAIVMATSVTSYEDTRNDTWWRTMGWKASHLGHLIVQRLDRSELFVVLRGQHHGAHTPTLSQGDCQAPRSLIKARPSLLRPSSRSVGTALRTLRVEAAENTSTQAN